MGKIISEYLQSVNKQFQYYKLLGEKTFSQLSDDQLFHKASEESNSIAIIVNHLSGNMLSRWTNFLSEDGEKSWRKRDKEFEDLIKTRNELRHTWEMGWNCLFDAMDSIDENNFDQEIYIRNQGHTITEAINRQLAHYAYHVGQIVFIGQMIKKGDWQSLSIPKGNSRIYNQEKFSKAKHKAHFTDEYLKDEQK